MPTDQTVIETKTGWMIQCRNCQWHDFPKVGKPGASWTFNGDMVKPTFTPSMNYGLNQPGEHYNPEHPSTRCHFYVTDGVIDYLGDCSHVFRGKFPLEPWPQVTVDYYKALLTEPGK